MPADDSSLYGLKRKRNLKDGAEISSSTALAFASQMSSIISSASSSTSTSKTSHGRARPKKKSDIFSTHNRNVSARAARDLAPDHAGVFAPQQIHSTSGSALDPADLARIQRKLNDKARLYSALKRGDLDDGDERYTVDFDRKWAETHSRSPSPTASQPDDNPEENGEKVEYTDEFGRTRVGSRLDAALATHARESLEAAARGEHDDRFTARPSAPARVIYGDTIQHQAFAPDEAVAKAMEGLAAKRDRSATPPIQHFDAEAEVRTKGTGFFQFSRDEEERKRQMEGLEREREETERRRGEREERSAGGRGAREERKRAMEERREEIRRRGAKRKAEEFLGGLGFGKMPGTEMTEKIEEAIRKEVDEGET